MRTIVVVGGAGKKGSVVCARLCQNTKSRIICVDNFSTGDIANIEDIIVLKNFQFINLNAAKYQPWKDINDLMGRIQKMHEIYYLASTNDPHKMNDAHIQGLINFLEIANHHRSRVLLLSLEQYMSELDALGKDGAYYYTKKAGEALAAAFQKKNRIDLRIVEVDDETDDIADHLVRVMKGKP